MEHRGRVRCGGLGAEVDVRTSRRGEIGVRIADAVNPRFGRHVQSAVANRERPVYFGVPSLGDHLQLVMVELSSTVVARLEDGHVAVGLGDEQLAVGPDRRGLADSADTLLPFDRAVRCIEGEEVGRVVDYIDAAVVHQRR